MHKLKNSKKKIIVIYLSTKYSKTRDLKNFLRFYKKYKSGSPHQLIICFKQLSKFELKTRLKRIEKMEYFIDPINKNDQEWGTLKRICEIFKNNYIFFMNDYSYPITSNWLKNFDKFKKNKTIIGCTASKSSHFSNSFFRSSKDNYLIACLKIIYFFFKFPKFPNPHLRVNSFLIKANDYLEFIRNKKFNNKLQSLILESGYEGFTNFFLKRGYKIKVLDRFGTLYNLKNANKSKTFASYNQEGLIISDKQTRNYDKLSNKKRKKKYQQSWEQ
jgi:hypothetical protein